MYVCVKIKEKGRNKQSVALTCSLLLLLLWMVLFQTELAADAAFAAFASIPATQFNPYTAPRWLAAVADYDRRMAAAEQKVATKLRQLFHGLRVGGRFQFFSFLKKIRKAFLKQVFSSFFSV